MKLAFVIDPIEELKAYKDSSVAMMREAARRGHEVSAFEARSMFVRDASVRCLATPLAIHDDNERWYSPGEPRDARVADYDVVFMRKDPPFDQEYFYATLLLERAAAEGARVVNEPRALRDWNEKLAILRFPQFAPPTLVASDMARVHAFIDEHADVIVKKLDGMGGTMIFRVAAADPNRNVIVEAITDMGARTVMAQRFIPEIAQGDKRVILIDGKLVPHCLARIPKPGESRGNLAAGARGEAQPVSARHHEIAAVIGPALAERGLLFVGLDVIGDWLTELNVTSPTGFREIQDQTGLDVAGTFIDALLSKLR